MRTGIAYGFTISIGVLLGYFVDNPFWLVALPAVLSALVIISVTHTEKQRSEELRRAQDRVKRVLDEQRRFAYAKRYPSDSDYD